MSSRNREKYESSNPVVQTLLQRFLGRVIEGVVTQRPERVADLGCGEGLVAREVLARLPHVSYRGIELDPVAAAEAREAVPAAEIVEGDLTRVPVEPGWSDVTLCLEVLEHMDDPAPAVRRIAEWSGGLAIVSVPWEPFFRGGNLLRGKYLRQLGNHPEHVQQFTPRSFRRLLEREFAMVQVRVAFPWLLAFAAAPRR